METVEGELVPAPKKLVVGRPFPSREFARQAGIKGGKKGGTVVTQARRDGARLGQYKRIIDQVGCLPEHQNFLLNFLESGDTARAQVVRMCRDQLAKMQAADPDGIDTGASQARLTEIILKATEHQHGKAAIKIHQTNFNVELTLGENESMELLEQLSRSR